ncbi:MAG: Hpt domain-containing protein [Lachnospiraceae bacterium]|nr:Hpt domain-containing protein [Lachnospiraceae bacterium]
MNGILEALETYEIDTSLVIKKRFMGREELYIQFLKRFLEDENFSVLKEKLHMEDAKGAFLAAHNLKGVVESLGLAAIMPTIFPMVEVLRKDSLEGMDCLLEKAEVEYEKIMEILQA